MNWKKGIAKDLSWLGGITLTVIAFIFAEGWLILAVKLFGFAMATVIVTIVTLFLSWLVIYASSGSHNIGRFRDWLLRKEGNLSGQAKVAMKSGKMLAVLNTTVFLGPIVASVLMLMLGFERRRVYVYSIFCALLCAIIWCGLYSGIFWGIHAAVAGKGL